jgi:hypothetical protein
MSKIFCWTKELDLQVVSLCLDYVDEFTGSSLSGFFKEMAQRLNSDKTFQHPSMSSDKLRNRFTRMLAPNLVRHNELSPLKCSAPLTKLAQRLRSYRRICQAPSKVSRSSSVTQRETRNITST